MNKPAVSFLDECGLDELWQALWMIDGAAWIVWFEALEKSVRKSPFER